MKTVRFVDFVAGAEHYRDLAGVEVIIVTDDDGAPQFVVLPHEYYAQLRKNQRPPSGLSHDELLEVLKEPIDPDKYDWPEDDDDAEPQKPR